MINNDGEWEIWHEIYWASTLTIKSLFTLKDLFISKKICLCLLEKAQKSLKTYMKLQLWSQFVRIHTFQCSVDIYTRASANFAFVEAITIDVRTGLNQVSNILNGPDLTTRHPRHHQRTPLLLLSYKNSICSLLCTLRTVYRQWLRHSLEF